MKRDVGKNSWEKRDFTKLGKGSFLEERGRYLIGKFRKNIVGNFEMGNRI